MNGGQRSRAGEDVLLWAYVKQYGPRESNLCVATHEYAPDRDAKSCLERWKNYIKPGIKRDYSLKKNSICYSPLG